MARKTPLAEYPRSVVALVWALAALHWESEGKYSGATYKRLMEMVAVTDRSAFRKALAQAEKLGVLVVSYRRPQNKWGAVVRLKSSTLTTLKGALPRV